MPVEDVISIVGSSLWQGYFSFAFVRNPWDLVVSRYYYEISKKKINSDVPFLTWLYKAPPVIWVRDELTGYTHVDGEVAVSFIGRFENLQPDFETVCRKVGLDTPPLPHEKRRRVEKVHYSNYYDDAAVNFVGEKQTKAIEAFGYEFAYE